VRQLNMGKLFYFNQKGLIGLTAIQVGSLYCICSYIFTVDWFQKFIKKSQREMEIYRFDINGTFIPAFFLR
jgi:hypothetical protein